MADVQLDVASANRFINSLSKSLQALCHGCMDFDAGIEIVGYININIDSGSKVDYVLNEKVLKSTTNSMTFVSNSFLAKKEQPKTCKDGSCSPIPELNYPQHRSQGGYSYPATQLYRSSGIYSPHSQVLRGSQKRAWSGADWRSPRKFLRGAKSQYGSYQHQSSSQSDSHYSNQQPTDSVLPLSSHQSSTPQQDYSSSETQSQSDVNIKKEVEESADGSSGYQNTLDGDSTDQNNGTISDNVNIKADPDSLPPNQDTSNEDTITKSETDISNSFLQPTKTDNEFEGDPSNEGENPDNSMTNYEDSTFDAHGESSGAGENSENPNLNDDSQGPSGADADYDGSGEMFPQSSYSGEGSSSGGGQFEVIEIDDEDEDVAAMFNDTHGALDRSSRKIHATPLFRQAPPRSEENHSRPRQGRNYNLAYEDNPVSSNIPTKCAICEKEFWERKDHQKHMNVFHVGQSDLPYVCSICQFGFYTPTGLRIHMIKHQGRLFHCTVCNASFQIETSVKRHMVNIHNLKQCRMCGALHSVLEAKHHVCQQH